MLSPALEAAFALSRGSSAGGAAAPAAQGPAAWGSVFRAALPGGLQSGMAAEERSQEFGSAWPRVTFGQIFWIKTNFRMSGWPS